MRTLTERFWLKVTKTSTCWLWGAAKCTSGYGVIGDSGGLQLAHRLSWKMHHGEIPPSLTVDHICRNKLCVNPSHLRLLTLADNVRDGMVMRGGIQWKKYGLSKGRDTDTIKKATTRGLPREMICQIFNIPPEVLDQIVKL